MSPTTRVIDAAAHELATATLRAVVEGLPRPPVPRFPGALEPASVFVTLRVGKTLRGCLGDTSFDRPLGPLVSEMTEAAATRDPRFPPVSPAELDRVTLEISRLTRPKAVTIDRLEMGRHGIIVSLDGRRALLLPQVAEEFDCDPQQFVALACRKAGLRPEAAVDPRLDITCFEVEVIGA